MLFESDLDICWLKELLMSAIFDDGLLKKDENVALILEVFEVVRWFLFLWLMGDCYDSDRIPLLSEAKAALMQLFQFYYIAGGRMNTTLSFISSLNVVFYLLGKFS